MTIEIFGGGFTNKGAELMLRTTLARLRERRPNLRFAIEPTRNSPYETRAELQLAHIFPSFALFSPNVRRVLLRSSIATSLAYAPLRLLMPRAAEGMLGLVDRRSTDALVDISGYAFGDGFHWLKCRAAAVRAASYARRGKPVILMPQMFGPFKNPKTVRYFRQMCKHATLIYAREQASLDAVRDLIGDDPRLKLAPDITIFSSKHDLVPTGYEGESYAVIVPNERMLDQGKKEWGETYLSRLRAAAQQMHKHGLRPAIVIHSGDPGDDRLAQQLLAALETDLGTDVPFVYKHASPLMLKKFIAGANFLVGSRFHSLVAALSSEVPGVALGWAHKYDMLASDFGVPQLIHRGTDKPEQLLSLIDQMADQVTNQSLRSTLREKRAAMQSQSEQMWDEVFRVLGMAGQVS